MPTTYATVADVATELRSLFPAGFGAMTVPSESDITAKIAETTTSLRVRVIRALGAEPSAGDDAAALIKRGVVAYAASWALRVAAIGQSANDVELLVKPYTDTYKDVKAEIDLLPDLFRATTVQGRSVGSTKPENVRCPVLADDVGNRTDNY